MKKFLATLLVLTMVVSASVCALADFVPSIGVKEEPAVEKSVIVDDKGKETEIEIVVTAISNKDDLTEEQKQEIEAAYEKLGDEKIIADISKDAGFDKKAVIAEVFDISTDTEIKPGEVLEVTFKTTTDYSGKNIAIGHYVGSKWVIERDVTIEGNTIKVKIKGTSPFAIIVEGTEEIKNTTSLGTIIWIAAIVVVVILAVVFIVIYVKKNKDGKKNTAKKSK